MMNRVSTLAVVGTLAVALVGGIAAPRAAFAGQAKPSLVALLKQAKIQYMPNENEFKIPVSIDGETSMLIARENALGNNDELKVVHIYTSVIAFPEGYKIPAALLRKIAEVNDSMLVGKVSVDEKGQCVWFSSSFWLRSADAQTLSTELELAHFMRMGLRKDLQPFVKE